MSFSIIAKDQLVLRAKVNKVSEISKYLYNNNIDKLIILCQGTLVTEMVKDGYKLSNITMNHVKVPFIIKEDDISFFSELCNTLGIEDCRIINYYDYIANKFRKEGKILVVDNHLNDYSVSYIDNGIIKDFRKSSKSNLQSVIGTFMKSYPYPVIAVQDSVNYIELRGALKNFEKISKDELFTLSHVPYCLDTEGKQLLLSEASSEENKAQWSSEQVDSTFLDEDSLIKDNEFEFEEDLDEYEVEKHTKIPSNRKTKKFTRNEEPSEIFKDQDEEYNKFINIAVTAGLIVMGCLLVIGVFLSILYKGEIKLLEKKVGVLEDRVNTSSRTTEYYSGDMSKSPAKDLSLIYKETRDLGASNYVYNNGIFNVTLLAMSEEQTNSSVETLKKRFQLDGSATIDKFKSGDTDYVRARVTVIPRAT
jgi:hypothetical protein